MRAILIGLGGIGSQLVDPLARTLAYSSGERSSKKLLLVDGDTYSKRNRERQQFTIVANKAEATCDRLEKHFQEL